MSSSVNRREFLSKGAAVAGLSALGATFGADPADAAPAVPAAPRFVSAQEFGAKGDGKTDDTEALRKAFKSVPKGTAVYLPRGKYVISGAIDLEVTTSLLGEPFGAQIYVKHYDAPAVRVPGECRVSDVAFIYDENTDLINPKPSPETVSLIGNGAGYIDNITFINAFIGVGTPEKGANCGQSVIRKLNGFVHDTMVRIDGSLDIVRIENVHCFVAMGESEPDKSYYRRNRKCFDIRGSDGTLISKSFMIFGKIFLSKQAGLHTGGLSTYLSQCWFEGMSDYGILLNDGTRTSMVGVEMACAYAKAVVELNNGAAARMNSCYIRDSFNSKGVVVNKGSSLILSDSELSGCPGFTAVELNSSETSIISSNYIHHCEVGIRCSEAASNYIITGNSISANNPLPGVGGERTIVKDNL